MCAIIGALLAPWNHFKDYTILKEVWKLSHERGRDGRGWSAQLRQEPHYMTHKDVERYDGQKLDGIVFCKSPSVFVGNLRAEPTTEYVSAKLNMDQQPYKVDEWTIVHNGTIANDRELRKSLPVGSSTVHTTIDSAAIAEILAAEDAEGQCSVNPRHVFERAIRKLKGSYAILAMCKRDPDRLFFACNYRPLWYIEVPGMGVVVASARDYLPEQYGPRMVQPYSYGAFVRDAKGNATADYWGDLRGPAKSQSKALVVCSGGLDSVVAATYAQKVMGFDVTLLHFHYGSRAGDPEWQALKAVAKELDVDFITQKIDVYRKEDSPLLQADSKIAGGEAGAEFAYEWVPARNLLMLSMATAMAEARGMEVIVLGNNLEEAGAYPDNEPEFIAKFNDLLPFAVGDGKRMKVIMPVGNMMKHEIVKLGLEIGAPLHLTWSCYRAIAKDAWDGKHQYQRYTHCGKCGPCFMRRTAFKINNASEVIDYVEE